eukprot:jgi/Galph1/2162/GphlegSOOS_G862.1
MKQILQAQDAVTVVQTLGVLKSKELLLRTPLDISNILRKIFHGERKQEYTLSSPFWEELVKCVYGGLIEPLPLFSQQPMLGCERLSLGCSQIDRFLNGGLTTCYGQIYEFCGEAGTGKTQLMLQLSLTCQLEKRNGGLDSRTFPIKRLEQLVLFWTKKYPQLERKDPSSNIIIERAPDVEQLQLLVESRLPYLLSKTGARLVIFDSLAAPFRHETNDSRPHRSIILHRLGNEMKQAAFRHHTVIVVVNQMTSQPVNPNCMSESLFEQVPYLGNSWTQNVNHRFILRKPSFIKVAYKENVNSSDIYELREMKVVFSPEMSCGAKIMIQLRKDGVQGDVQDVWMS